MNKAPDVVEGLAVFRGEVGDLGSIRCRGTIQCGHALKRIVDRGAFHVGLPGLLNGEQGLHLSGYMRQE